MGNLSCCTKAFSLQSLKYSSLFSVFFGLKAPKVFVKNESYIKYFVSNIGTVYRMPPRINGRAVASIVSASNPSVKMEAASVTSKMFEQVQLFDTSTWHSNLSARMVALELQVNQLTKLNQGMVQLITDMVNIQTSQHCALASPNLASNITHVSQYLAPSTPWSPATSFTSSSAPSEVTDRDSEASTAAPPPARPSIEEQRSQGRRRAEQRDMARRANFVDTVAARYGSSNPHLADDILCADFALTWHTCCDTEVQWTPPPPAPTPAFIPNPYPRIQWGRLNQHALKNLPQPTMNPIHGCPIDPNFYIKRQDRWTQRCQGRAFSCGCVRCDVPFGRAAGFVTDKGNIAVPDHPIHGYIYSGGNWVIHAEVDTLP